MHLKRLFAIALLANFALTSCNFYPGGDARTDELDVVITQYDPNADFSAMKTYALAPKIKELSVDPNQPPQFTISEELNNLVMVTIEANMAAYGWTKVDTTESPDLALDLGATITRSTNIYGSYPGYGWGYPGYGWSYPWFPYSSTVTSYDVGTLIIVGLDLNNIDSGEMTIPVLWHGLIQGPLIGNVKDPLSRMQRDINIAFEQSSYLNLN